MEQQKSNSFQERPETKHLNVSDFAEVCRRRYRDMKRKCDQQFRNELQTLEKMQPTAHEAMRFHRHFALTTLWPCLHTRKEIEWTIRYFQDPLAPKERRRLEKILSERTYSWLDKTE